MGFRVKNAEMFRVRLAVLFLARHVAASNRNAAGTCPTRSVPLFPRKSVPRSVRTCTGAKCAIRGGKTSPGLSMYHHPPMGIHYTYLLYVIVKCIIHSA